MYAFSNVQGAVGETRSDPLAPNSPTHRQVLNDMIDNGNQFGDIVESIDDCLICSEAQRDALFSPCGHVCACSVCATRVKRCLLCKEPVQSKSKVTK